jgi:hypothetical protein
MLGSFSAMGAAWFSRCLISLLQGLVASIPTAFCFSLTFTQFPIELRLRQSPYSPLLPNENQRSVVCPHGSGINQCITASGKNSSTLSCRLSRRRRKITKPPTFARAPKNNQIINFGARPVQSIRVFCVCAQNQSSNQLWGAPSSINQGLLCACPKPLK